MVSRIPHDTTQIFTDIFPDEETFISSWKESGLYKEGLLTDSNATLLFYLLYSRYGNSAIANWDVTQFKYRVYATIFQYGPTWQKRLEVQEKIRGLDESELMTGAKAIHNHAFNPSAAPTTDTLESLSYINDQNTTNYKRSKLEAYESLMNLLETDVTSEFLDRFKPLFARFIHTRPDIYVTEEDE